MTSAPLLLALDLSTKVGWACGRAGAEPDYGVIRLPSAALGLGATMAALVDALADLQDVQHFERVVMEAPIQQHKGAAAARQQLGLAACVELWCYRREIMCREAASSTVRKNTVGSGRAKKPEVMAWCATQGWTPPDDNAADALALWRYATTRPGGRMAA